MKQVWPPQPPASEGASSFGTRLFWCHRGITWTLPIALMLLSAWLILDRNVIVGVVLLLVVAACLVSIVRAWREARLGRDGAQAQGEVIDIQAGRGATPIQKVYLVRYRFQDARGQTVTGQLRSHRPTNWMFYDGAPIEVRYDPRHPQRNTLRSI